MLFTARWTRAGIAPMAIAIRAGALFLLLLPAFLCLLAECGLALRSDKAWPPLGGAWLSSLASASNLASLLRETKPGVSAPSTTTHLTASSTKQPALRFHAVLLRVIPDFIPTYSDVCTRALATFSGHDAERPTSPTRKSPVQSCTASQLPFATSAGRRI